MAEGAITFLLANLKELLYYHENLLASNTKYQVRQLVEELDRLKYLDLSRKKRIKDIHEGEIKMAAYEVEDMVDSYLVSADANFRRLLFAPNLMAWSTLLMEPIGAETLLRSSIQSSFGLCIGPTLAHQLKSFRENKLKPLIKKIEKLPLLKHKDSYADVDKKQQREIPLRHDNVVGLEDELKTLIGYIINEESESLDVISITGMPGIGKTTMAWRIFNSPKIEYEFPTRIWVDVSQDLNIRDVCLTILRKITEESSSSKSDKELISMVSDHLKSKKFLIILDDVWTSEAWNQIKQVLSMRNARGKVLITTSNDNVAHHVNLHRIPHKLRFLKPEESWTLLLLDVFPHKLRFLKPEESWTLLPLNVFGMIKDCSLELEDIGKVIADRCEGLPLSVIVIAGILSMLQSEGMALKKEWESICESVSTCIFDTEDQRARNTMSQSYASLPGDLKECFLYLGMFPKDTEIPVWKLIRLWIAEGFIRNKKTGGSLEEIAQQKLRELRDRNLLVFDKVNICGEVKTCSVHSMVHEYCKNEADMLREFREINKTRQGIFEPPISELDSYRRLCIHSCVWDFFFSKKPKVARCRSFLCYSEEPCIALEPREILSITDAFSLIRVLDADAIQFPTFPHKITKWIHLRYITLSVADLKILPEAISTFWNLQTLVVSTSSRTLKIKANIWKMINLRHLKTTSSIFLKNRKGEGGDNLQTITKLSPRSFIKRVAKKAKNLVKLGIRGRLLESMCFDGLSRLEKLSLDHDVYPMDNSENKLRSLPKSIASLEKLRSLVLSGTYLEWTYMSTLGCLPALEVLKLKNNAFCGSTWETDGGFGNLVALVIEQTNLKYWVAPSNSFLKLRSLEFKNCERLVQIPEDLGLTLKELLMSGVTKYAVAYAKKIEQKMAMKGGSSSKSKLESYDHTTFRYEADYADGKRKRLAEIEEI